MRCHVRHLSQCRACSPGITHHIRILWGNSANRRCVQGAANVGLQLWVCETQRFMQWWRLKGPHRPQAGPGGAVSIWILRPEDQETQVPGWAQEETNVPAQTQRRRMLSSSAICSSQGSVGWMEPPTLTAQSLILNLQVQLLPLSRNIPQAGPGSVFKRISGCSLSSLVDPSH